MCLFPWRSFLTVAQTVWHVSRVSMWICSHLWTGQLVHADLLIMMFDNRAAASCTVYPLHICGQRQQKICSSVCSPSPPVACLSPTAAGESEEVTRLLSFTLILKILVLSTAAALKSVLLHFQLQTVQTGFWMGFVSYYHVLPQPAVAGRDDKAVWVPGKPRKTAKDVKLNGEHTDGVINTLARWASSPYPSASCCIQIFLESNFAGFGGAFSSLGHLGGEKSWQTRLKKLSPE